MTSEQVGRDAPVSADEATSGSLVIHAGDESVSLAGRRLWRALLVICASFALNNVILMPLFSAVFGQRELRGLLGACVGVMGAELALVGGFLVFSRQRVIWRIILAWLAALGCFFSWALGFWLLITTGEITYSFEQMLHEMGLVGFAVFVLIGAVVIGLTLVRQVQDVRLVCRLDEQEAPTVRWSILELLILTTMTAVTAGLFRLMPIRPTTYPFTAEFLALLLMFALAVVMSSLVTCFLLMHLVLQVDSRHPERRTWILGGLIVTQFALVLLGFITPRSYIAAWSLIALASAGCAFITTLVAVLVAVQRVGWQLKWD